MNTSQKLAKDRPLANRLGIETARFVSREKINEPDLIVKRNFASLFHWRKEDLSDRNVDDLS